MNQMVLDSPEKGSAIPVPKFNNVLYRMTCSYTKIPAFLRKLEPMRQKGTWERGERVLLWEGRGGKASEIVKKAWHRLWTGPYWENIGFVQPWTLDNGPPSKDQVRLGQIELGASSKMFHMQTPVQSRIFFDQAPLRH